MRLQPDRLLTKRVDPLVMKTLNAIELLELIRTNGPVSRAQLATRSRLSKPTVSDQVDSLISRSLVMEAGPGNAGIRGGKKPTLLEFNCGYGQILSADIGPEWMRFAAADLCGNFLIREQLATTPEKGARAVVRTLKRGLEDLLARVPEANIRVISVAVPGIVDVRQGVVLETDNVFGWRDVKLTEELSKEFDLPVRIDNDVNMAALAELSAGSAPDNFVFIRLHTGIGSAVVLGGELHHGAHWAAGEIGHMLLDIRALDAEANPRGYLESVVGQDRVRERIRKLARRGGRTGAEQQAAGDVALHLGSAIANIASVYDPEAIILLGEPFGAVLDEIRRVTRKLVPWPVEIRLSKLGEDAALHGALAAGLNHAFGQIARTLQTVAAGQVALTAAQT
jgi:predicted NBD/HSP70 family sugar kinase